MARGNLKNSRAVAVLLTAVLGMPMLGLDVPETTNRKVTTAFGNSKIGIDLSGGWTALFHEDIQDRLPGPELGDYLGLPINDADRLKAESWSASVITLPERQCMPHSADYAQRGPFQFYLSNVVDDTGRFLGIHQQAGGSRTSRTFWMDGRPHPSEYAAHTWQGFSTAKWVGETLVVQTTHLKVGELRRNGVARSDEGTLTEYFVRHDNYLTIMEVIDDPVYLTEPLVRSTDFVLNLHQALGSGAPCQPAIEIVRPLGVVPHYLPGKNPFIVEFLQKRHVTAEEARGGAETMYPEYQLKMAGKVASITIPREVEVQAPASPSKPAAGGVEVLPVQGNVYMAASPSGNVTLQIGKEGVLLVDSGTASQSDELVAAIRKLTKGPIQYIINTDSALEHTGGNGSIAKQGDAASAPRMPSPYAPSSEPTAVILAHVDVLARMSSSSGKTPAMPEASWPTDTYIEPKRDLAFNDEGIEIIHQPAANMDGNSVVFFRQSNVVSTGDIFLTTSYPVIDVEHGGTIQGVIDGLNHIIDITIPAGDEEGGTMVIPGKGRLCDEADVVEYRDMVTIIRDRIQDMVKRGMTLEQVKAAQPSNDYDPRYGSSTGPWTTDQFVTAIYRNLTEKTATGEKH
jgi:cyclase